MTKKSDYLLNALGIYMLLIFVYNLINMFYVGEQLEIFWLCNHVTLIIGLAILLRSQKVLIAELSIIFLVSLVWTIDLIFLFTTGMSLISDIRFFWDQNIFYQIATVLIHTTVIPISLWAIFIIRKRVEIKKTMAIFLLHWVALISFGYFLKGYNFNCVFHSCINFIPDFKFHFLMAIGVYSILMIIVNYAINKILGNLRS